MTPSSILSCKQALRIGPLEFSRAVLQTASPANGWAQEEGEMLVCQVGAQAVEAAPALANNHGESGPRRVMPGPLHMLHISIAASPDAQGAEVQMQAW